MLLKKKKSNKFLCVDCAVENLSKGVCLSDTLVQIQLKIRISHSLLVTSRDQIFSFSCSMAFTLELGIFHSRYTRERAAKEVSLCLLFCLYSTKKETSENILHGK